MIPVFSRNRISEWSPPEENAPVIRCRDQSRSRTSSSVIPSIDRIFFRPLSPFVILMRDLAIPSVFATSLTSSSLARPSAGGEFKWALRSPRSSRAMALRDDLGVTVTEMSVRVFMRRVSSRSYDGATDFYLTRAGIRHGLLMRDKPAAGCPDDTR